MSVHIGINGFGRLGRVFFRTCLEYNQLQVTAINDPIIDLDYICYLIKFDSTHGNFKGTVEKTENGIIVNGKLVQIFHHKKPQFIPWYLAGVDYVVEASGMFTTLEKASLHFGGGAKDSSGVRRVIVTAPSNDAPVIILGVNHDDINPDMKIISCSSSTLYCLAPLVKVLDDQFGVTEGMMTSVHAMTPALKPIDGFCSRSKHWREHRGALQNIIPATSGACRALGRLLPHLRGRLSGIAYRVPVVDVSVLDLTVRLEKGTNLLEIKKCIDKASHFHMKNIIKSSQDEAVSSDFIGDEHSCILDVNTSIALNEHFFKLVCWYENEYSYACRVAEVILFAEDLTTLSLPIKKNKISANQPRSQDLVPYNSSNTEFRSKKSDSKAFIVPIIKPIVDKLMNISPYPLKSPCIRDNELNFTNNMSKEENLNHPFNIRNNKHYDVEKGSLIEVYQERKIYGVNEEVAGSSKDGESNHWPSSSECETRHGFTDENRGRSESRLIKINDTICNDTSNRICVEENTAHTVPSKPSYKKINGNINLEICSNSSAKDASISAELEYVDICETNTINLSENDITKCGFALKGEPMNKLQNENLIQCETKEFKVMNDSYTDTMLEVSYNKESLTVEHDAFVYFVSESQREYENDNYNNNSLSSMKEVRQIDEQKYHGFDKSHSNQIDVKSEGEDMLYYVNQSKMDVPSDENILTVFKAQNSVSIDKFTNMSKPSRDQMGRSLVLCDKVESSSNTDSDNSFQIHEKKSMEIKLADVTDSLEELEKLDKICKIIEISDDLSDNLFRKLENVQNVMRSSESWSLKEFCERVNLDDFFK